jgi:hypothetical protein
MCTTLVATQRDVNGASPRSTTYIVAIDGNDGWSGTLQSPNQTHTDGPFATLARAQDAVRKVDHKTHVMVLVRAGTYYLPAPLVFTPQDSGTAACPVVYAAYKNEKPVISGGAEVSGWRVNASGGWEADLPYVKAGKWNFSQLFVDDGSLKNPALDAYGARRYRPRLPHSGYYNIDADVSPSSASAGRGFDRFGFKNGEIVGDWHNLADVEILPFHIWGMGRFGIKDVDKAQSIVTLSGPSPTMDWWGGLPKGNRYLIENVREALDTPGQWYLDRVSGVLTYLPLPGESLTKTRVTAPRLDQICVLRGDIDGRKWVQYITFKGIAFAHSNWVIPPAGHDVPQAESDLTAAVSAVGARHCAFQNCQFTHLGGYGISLADGCQYNSILDSEITDLGGGGVKLGGSELTRDDEAVAKNNTVTHCVIAHGGRLHPAGIGVWIGQSPDNSVDHNDIYDFYYTGVSEGWTWGYGTSLASGNVITYNRIHRIGQGVLSDMGGIYTVGGRAGTVLDNNVIYDVASFSYGGWGIYFDEGSSDVLATNNIVYSTTSAGFHQHYGKDNIVKNNIFAFGGEAQLMRTRAEDHLSFTIENNIVLSNGTPILGSNWTGSNYKIDNNLYWTTNGSPAVMDGKTWAQWQAQGNDIHSLYADPKFVDPVNANFTLNNGSPSSQIGFQPIDVRFVGTGRSPAGVVNVAPAFPLNDKGREMDR